MMRDLAYSWLGWPARRWILPQYRPLRGAGESRLLSDAAIGGVRPASDVPMWDDQAEASTMKSMLQCYSSCKAAMARRRPILYLYVCFTACLLGQALLTDTETVGLQEHVPSAQCTFRAP